jgi:TonB-linked outer membrane protein, SusC/RagA family/TonB-dependent outer membrane receptor, SusC/RagA subfamily, signature region
MKGKIFLKLLFLVLGTVLSISLFAQQINVRGVVQDVSGEPITGANVLVKGTSNVTFTDLDGIFNLNNVQQGSILVISFVGYKEQEVPATENMNIILKEDTNLLDEVVVIGYGQVRKNDATGAVSAISADKITKGMATSASDLLVGKIAGVSVVTDGGAPGSAASIRIRGGSSMSASNDPLIVIDGVPVDNGEIKGMANPLASIHPSDIETFTVLKDASATAIYGSRASNGVIIITTKTGKSGKINVNYSGTFSISTKAKNVDVMSADTFREYVKSLYAEDSPQVLALGTANTNWQDEIFRTAFSTDHNVSVSGAVAKMPYRVSVSYTNEDGILKTSNLQRTTASVALNPKFIDNRLDVKINVKGVYNKNRYADGGAINSAIQFDPTQPVYMEGSQYGNGYYMSLDANKEPIKIALANPLAYLEEINDVSDIYRSIGNIQFNYKFNSIPGLNANLNLGYDVSESNGKKTINDNSAITWCTGGFKNGFGENTEFWQLKRNHLLDFYLNYATDLNKNNHFDVMAGYSWQHFYRNHNTKYPYSAEMAQLKGTDKYKDDDPNYPTENYLVSFFGRLNYSFKNKYLLTFTLREDGSSRFSKDDRWGLFPSVALAWKLKEETFLKGVDLFSDLKLRLGWGITGQQDLSNGDYPYIARYTYSKSGANYFFGDNAYSLIRPEAYDAHLKWEKTTTWNVGLDYGLLNDRMTGTLDLYYRETKDLLNTVSVPGGSNYNNQILTNVGSLVNKGVEFTLTARPVVSSDWNWELNYNMSYNKNEITKLTFNDDPNYVGVIHGGIDGGTGSNILIHQVGKPFNSFYVYKQVYDIDGKPIEGYYEDINGDGEIKKEDDLVAYKKAAPDVIMGLSSNLSYKNWDFAFSLRASIGNYAYNNVQSNTEAHGSAIYDPAGFLKNRNNSAKYTNFENVRYFSSYYVQNASFLKCDNVTLGYRFNKIFNDTQSARVYFTVQNPFVITKYDGIDPEFNNGGIDNRIYPHARIFMVGLNINF